MNDPHVVALNYRIDPGITVFQLVIASPDQIGMTRKIAEEMLPRVKRAVSVH